MAHKIKHPSWRVFIAIKECDISPRDFDLLDGADIYIPYENKDELTLGLIEYLKGELKEDIFGIAECHGIFSDTYERQVLESMLLNNRPPAEISATLKLSSSAVLTYSSLYFDTTVFSNDVEKLVYIRKGTYGCDQKAKIELRERGEEFMKASRGVHPDKISVEQLLSEMLAKSYVKYMTNVDSDPYTAQGWASISTKIASQLMKKKSGSTPIEEFFVQLMDTAPPKTTREDLL